MRVYSLNLGVLAHALSHFIELDPSNHTQANALFEFFGPGHASQTTIDPSGILYVKPDRPYEHLSDYEASLD